MTIVVPARWISRIRSMHLSWNARSPTARTSSSTSTSGCVCTATANASRRNMPEL
jgi:hypothetical protein